MRKLCEDFICGSADWRPFSSRESDGSVERVAFPTLGNGPFRPPTQEIGSFSSPQIRCSAEQAGFGGNF
jgi:hypothetical protein